jgi:hypothetical protein
MVWAVFVACHYLLKKNAMNAQNDETFCWTTVTAQGILLNRERKAHLVVDQTNSDVFHNVQFDNIHIYIIFVLRAAPEHARVHLSYAINFVRLVQNT